MNNNPGEQAYKNIQGQDYQGNDISRQTFQMAPSRATNSTYQQDQQLQKKESSFFDNMMSGFKNMVAAKPQKEVRREKVKEYKDPLNYMSSFDNKNIMITGCAQDVGMKVTKRFFDHMQEKYQEQSQYQKHIEQLSEDLAFPSIVLVIREDEISIIDKEFISNDNYRHLQEYIRNCNSFRMQSDNAAPCPYKVVYCDLDNPQEIQRKFTGIMVDPFKGRLDHMFLCHGSDEYDYLNTIQAEVPDYDNSFRINVRASMHLISMAIPFMKLNQTQNKGSSITVLTSAAGVKPDPYQTLKCTHYAMLNMMIQCVALETAVFGIRVNGVAAGLIKRGEKQDRFSMDHKDLPIKYGKQTQGSEATYETKFIDAEDIASSMMFMTSDQTAFSTGEILTIDSGFSQTSSLFKEFENALETNQFQLEKVQLIN